MCEQKIWEKGITICPHPAVANCASCLIGICSAHIQECENCEQMFCSACVDDHRRAEQQRMSYEVDIFLMRTGAA